MRLRFAAVSAVAFSLVALLTATQAQAAAEVHRLNLVISGIPTQVVGGDFNDQIDYFNRARLDPRGLELIKHPDFTWAYDVELRYFAQKNFALTAGLTQIRAQQKREFLPAIAQSINLRAELLSVPIHVGGLYYLQAYNQGDFQARAYVGGGLMQYVYTRATFEQTLTNADSTLNANWLAPGHPEYGSSYRVVLTQDAPGYYVEAGAHMFFAARYSMVLGAVYRGGKIRNVRLDQINSGGQIVSGSSPGELVDNVNGGPYHLDLGGLGVKFALGIGL